MFNKNKEKMKLNKEFGIMVKEKRDFSKECSHDDTTDNRCLFCTNYIYPIGCNKK